jgi:hypothetical protein
MTLYQSVIHYCQNLTEFNLPFKDEAQTALFKRPNPYRAVNTLDLGYKNQLVNVVWGTSRCLF